ncbi:hypothetical protein [Photorhabdus sp. SF281]|uniref:hypothetical protein n=1 Tax=Photorhabdus sp. SF281 TaxID=3459527 RepID=UPI0040444540
MLILKVVKVSAVFIITTSLMGCTYGKIDPDKVLTELHIKKNDNYKKRPGWSVIEKLSNDDCQTFKSNGKGLFDWGNSPCTTDKLIDLVNSNPHIIPIFYASYHEYGRAGVGQLSDDDFYAMRNDKNYTRMLYIFSRIADYVSHKSIVEGIYADFKTDRWSMGLNNVDEESFKVSLSKFAAQKDSIVVQYSQAMQERTRINAQENERIRKEGAKRKSEIEASLPAIRIYPDFGPNSSTSEKFIKEQLDHLHFTKKRSVDEYGNLATTYTYYVEGRKIYPTGNFDVIDFINGIKMTIQRCYEVGAYTDSRSVNNACVAGIAQGIKEWGATARDKSISDRAWFAGAIDGNNRYSPLDNEILFSHWAGMARVYSSRGF